MLDVGNYGNHHRSQRQHSTDGTNDYLSPAPLQTSSSSHYYKQQSIGLSRSITLPESQHHSRRSPSYNISHRQINNDNDIHPDGIKNYFIYYLMIYSINIDRHHARHRQPSVETVRYNK